MVELLITVLFMSIAGAVILNMFVMADRKAVRNAAFERALTDVQSFSEVYGLTGDLKASADRVYGAGCLTEGADGSYTVVLDEKNRPLVTEDGRSSYGRLRVTLWESGETTGAGRYSKVDIVVFRTADSSAAELMIQQSCSAYIPSFAAENGGGSDA